MNGRPKRCFKCKEIVCIIMEQNAGRTAKTVKPYRIVSGKYCCKDCADKEVRNDD